MVGWKRFSIYGSLEKSITRYLELNDINYFLAGVQGCLAEDNTMVF